MTTRQFAATICFAFALFGGGTACSEPFPGFVYLADIASGIVQDIRYAGSHNFVGRSIAGYEAAECVLTQKAARALANAQAQLAAKKLSLIVWDCYRPERAVADFVSWSKIAADTRMKAEFYPRTDKSKFFALGYIASRSGHSRGSTIDLGIVPDRVSAPPPFDPAAALRSCIAGRGERFDDHTIDFGTGYDCFDERASTHHPGIGKDALANRLLLQTTMERSGFRPYAKEWWHFELIDEPFRNRSFDFPVVKREAR
jgi:D-alanyl-D-alanine dipeptidase